MKYNNTDQVLSVILNPNELWLIAQLFGPGWIFGVDDPTDNLTKNEIAEIEVEVFSELSKEGLVSQKAGGKQIQIDEMLGAMVYSSIHSRDLLVVKDLIGDTERFLHFLPHWQMELYKTDEVYELTLFKDRSDLFQHILYAHGVTLNGNSDGTKFSIPARELEMSAFLFDSGKTDKAIDNLEGDIIEIPSVKIFLEGFLKPDCHLRYDLLLNRDDEERVHTNRNELLQLDDSLYWISYDEAGEEAVEMMNFTSVTPKKAEKRFNLMLPEN